VLAGGPQLSGGRYRRDSEDPLEAALRYSYFTGAPDLAVEIISPSDSAAEIDDKTSLYFRYGAQECWTVNLRCRPVIVHSVDQPRRVYSLHDHSGKPVWHRRAAAAQRGLRLVQLLV
jgi:Uma2 family endonuclease